MKFTKTLAISLFALGAMQFAMAETVKIDFKGAATGMVNKIASINDVIEVTFIDTTASTGQTINIYTPSFIKIKDDIKEALPSGALRTVSFEVTGTPKQSEPIKIGLSEKDVQYKIKIGPRLK